MNEPKCRIRQTGRFNYTAELNYPSQLNMDKYCLTLLGAKIAVRRYKKRWKKDHGDIYPRTVWEE